MNARPSIFIIIFISAEENSEVQASTINAEQMVKDSGRGPASKVALVYASLHNVHFVKYDGPVVKMALYMLQGHIM